MEEKTLVIPCRTTAGVFRSFAVFETFLRQKRWRNPLLFAVIFSAFALVCFTLGRKFPDAGLIGGVLLFVGLGLPGFYLVNFLVSVNRQAKGLHLDGERIVYTVRLDGEGFSVENDRERQSFSWDGMACAYRLGSCILLYPTDDQAYVLPDENGGREEENAWALICRRLPKEKVFDRRKS